MHVSSKHVIAGAVALASFGLALNQGGYSVGLIAGAAFALWWTILLCIGLRIPRRGTIPAVAVGAGASLAALAAWTALSWVWASDNGAVFTEIVRVLSYLGLFTLVVIVSGREGEGARPWLAGLAIGLTAVAALAMATRFEPSLGSGDLTRARLSYPIGYWNGLGACAALASTLLVWHSAHARERLSRVIATAALPLPALAIFLSGSRGGVAAALLGAALVVALGPARQVLLASLALAAAGAASLIVFANSRADLLDGLTGTTAAAQGRELLLACLLVIGLIAFARHRFDGPLREASLPPLAKRLIVAAAALALVATLVAQDPISRFESFKQRPSEGEGLAISDHFSNDNGSGRYQFWGAALDALGEHPLNGIGAGQYEEWWNEHGSIYRVLRDAHSLLFEVGAELGLVGLALLLSFVAIAARSGWRRRAGPARSEAGALLALLGAGLLAASIDWMWELPAAFGPAIVAAALLTGPATEPEPARPDPNPGDGALARRRLALGAATIAVAWVALWCSGDLLLTETKLEQSRSAAAEQDLTQAAEAANAAVALAPWAAEPRLQLGLVQEAEGDFGAAAATLRGATDRGPDDWRIWFTLSRVEASSGRPAAARAALRRAREVNPRSPFLRGVSGELKAGTFGAGG